MKSCYLGMSVVGIVLYMTAPLIRAQQPVGVAAQGGSPSTTSSSLDFEFYRTRVEPIFLKRRPDHPRCYSCHKAVQDPQAKEPAVDPGFIPNAGITSGTVAVSAASIFHLEWLLPGNTTWTEEQSRRNFEHVSTLVTPGDPGKSLLLMHPLAPEAGGDARHGGGRQFTTQDDPDWLAMAQWVRQKGVSGQQTNNQ
jgi:hypothetical protein